MESEEMNEDGHLKELEGSDFEIANGQPDITGWEVKDSEGTVIGTVDDLLFSPEARKVRYVIIGTDGDTAPERQVLMPIGVAELHPEDDEVIVPGVTMEQLTDLPLYEKGKISPDDEYRIRSVFDGLQADTYNQSTYNRGEFYSHDHFDDERMYASRGVSAQNEAIPLEEGFGDDDDTEIPTVYDSDEVTTRHQGDDNLLIEAETTDDFGDSEPNYTGEPDKITGSSAEYPKDGDDRYGKTPL